MSKSTIGKIKEEKFRISTLSNPEHWPKEIPKLDPQVDHPGNRKNKVTKRGLTLYTILYPVSVVVCTTEQNGMYYVEGRRMDGIMERAEAPLKFSASKCMTTAGSFHPGSRQYQCMVNWTECKAPGCQLHLFTSTVLDSSMADKN